MPEETHTFKQQIVEIERIAANKRLFVTLEDDREPRHLRIGRVFIKVLRRLLDVLRMADPRKCSPVLHELFVEAERTVDGFDNRDLIVVVVDRELACEPGANWGEPVAITSKQTNAE